MCTIEGESNLDGQPLIACSSLLHKQTVYSVHLRYNFLSKSFKLLHTIAWRSLSAGPVIENTGGYKEKKASEKSFRSSLRVRLTRAEMNSLFNTMSWGHRTLLFSSLKSRIAKNKLLPTNILELYPRLRAGYNLRNSDFYVPRAKSE